MTRLERSTRTMVLALCCAAAAAAAGEARSDDNPWGSGKHWVSLRAGYAKSTVAGAGHGGGGYGFAYSRHLGPVKIYKWTLFKYFSLGGSVHHEWIGRFGDATEVEVPVTLELTRHFRWNTALRPYLGVGGGAFYRKTNRTGDDLRELRAGYLLAAGANAPIDERHLVGVDGRFIRVGARNNPPNPVFGPGAEQGTHLSLKVSYTLVY